MAKPGIIEINQQQDIVTARKVGRDLARDLGFSIADQTRLATSISELARNVLNYAKSGTCTVTDDSNGEMIRVQVVVEDQGSGIADIEKAMVDGFSTGNGRGAGLPGTKRLVHDFEIESEPGQTKVTIGMNMRRNR